MRVLKIKTWQDSAHFRVPHTSRTLQTLPVPMFSTVIGFLCACLEEESRRRLLESLQLAVFSKYDSLFQDRVWYRNLSKKQHNGRFKSEENRTLDGRVESFGGQSPITVERLHNVTTIIYAICDAEITDELHRALADGSGSLHLGLAEDTAAITEVRVIEFEGEPEIFSGRVDYYSWLPESSEGWGLGENYGEFFERVSGNMRLVSSVYSLVRVEDRIVRDFEYLRCKLFTPRGLPISLREPYRFYVDSDERIPLWFSALRGRADET